MCSLPNSKSQLYLKCFSALPNTSNYIPLICQCSFNIMAADDHYLAKQWTQCMRALNKMSIEIQKTSKPLEILLEAFRTFAKPWFRSLDYIRIISFLIHCMVVLQVKLSFVDLIGFFVWHEDLVKKLMIANYWLLQYLMGSLYCVHFPCANFNLNVNHKLLNVLLHQSSIIELFISLL